MTRHVTEALGQLCDVSIGRTPRRSESRFWGGPHPWATIRDLDGGTLMATGEGITDAALDEVMPGPVEPGTLLFSFKLSIGKMGFAGRAMHHNEAIAALPVRDPGVLDSGFLFYALKATTHEGAASHAVLGKVLNKRKVEQIEIPVPPLDEQRRIVAILNRAARIERLRARAAERMREFVPALFVKMFGDPVENPIRWPVEAVGDLVTRGPQNGLYRPMSDYGAGTPILRIDGFYGGQVSHPATWQRVRLDKDTVSRYALEEGDIVINRVNGARRFLGKSAIVPNLEEPAVFESNMMRLQPDRRRVRPGFLIEMLQLASMKARLCSNAKEINQSSINQTDVKSCVVLTPPLELQEKFCDVADSVRRLTQQAELGSAEGATLLASTIAKLLSSGRTQG